MATATTFPPFLAGTIATRFIRLQERNAQCKLPATFLLDLQGRLAVHSKHFLHTVNTPKHFLHTVNTPKHFLHTANTSSFQELVSPVSLGGPLHHHTKRPLPQRIL